MKNKTDFTNRVKCPIKWFCKALDKWIEVAEEAVYNKMHGWICDCGSWVKEADAVHVNMVFGKRAVFGKEEALRCARKAK